MTRIPTQAPEIAASLRVRPLDARAEWAGRILDALDGAARTDPRRFAPEACEAVLGEMAAPAGGSPDWIESADSGPARLFLRARLAPAGDPEAGAARWDDFFRALPCLDPFVLLQAARAMAAAGRSGDAAAHLREALARRPPYSFHPRAQALLDQLWREVPPSAREARIAVVGSSTTALLVQVLRALCFRDGVRAEFYEGPYGAWRQEILDPASGLHAFRPTLVIVATHWRDLRLDPLVDDEAQVVADRAGEYVALWQRVADATGCHVVQHGFDVPAVESHDYVAARPGGRTRVIRLVNEGLALRAPRYVSIVDAAATQAEAGLDRWESPALWATAKQHPAPEAIPVLAEADMAHVRAVAGLTRKVVICDLDNTLWHGIIGEDGLHGIGVGPGSPAGEAHAALQEYLLELKSRGVLLAVCSKNNPEDARLPFEQHAGMRLRLDDFVAFRANWQDKVENLRALASTLSLGLDSFVFVDDNPFERAWVRSQLPEVAVVELGSSAFGYVRDLDRPRYFQSLAISAEDRERTALYRKTAEREALRGAAASLDDFLDQLQMRAADHPVGPSNLARVTQLVNKTNQFNLTTRRYTEPQVERMANDPGGWARAFHLADRFGDHGLIGVVICTRPDATTWEIDTWLMSCRVLGRRVEHEMFDRLRAAAAEAGVTRVVGVFRPTKKNALVADLLPQLGFEPTGESGEEHRYVLHVLPAAAPAPVEEHAEAGTR